MNRWAKKVHSTPAGDREAENSILRAGLVGIAAFFAVGLLSTLAVTAVVYLQKDPNAYSSLGMVCPYLAAVMSGGVGGRILKEKAWLTGGVIGLPSAALLWLFSAGVPREMSAGTSLLMYLGVAVASALGGAVFGARRSTARRHRRHHHRP